MGECDLPDTNQTWHQNDNLTARSLAAARWTEAKEGHELRYGRRRVLPRYGSETDLLNHHLGLDVRRLYLLFLVHANTTFLSLL